LFGSNGDGKVGAHKEVRAAITSVGTFETQWTGGRLSMQLYFQSCQNWGV